MDKNQVLVRINEIIAEEKGLPVTMEGTFSDAELDSLGTMIVISTLDAEFDIMTPMLIKELKDGITIKELIKKCILPNTSTSTEPNQEMGT
jgi:acyl carrier protein